MPTGSSCKRGWLALLPALAVLCMLPSHAAANRIMSRQQGLRSAGCSDATMAGELHSDFPCASPWTLNLRGGVGPDTLRARAAQMRNAASGGEGKQDAPCSAVHFCEGRLHCVLRGENVSLALDDLESPIQDWETAPSLLFPAAAEGHAPLVEALLSRGANFSRANDDGDTPLHIAAWHNNARVVRLLCAAGAQIDAGNMHEATPLHAAACAGSREAAMALLECGARRDCQDYLCLTPAQHAKVCMCVCVCLCLCVCVCPRLPLPHAREACRGCHLSVKEEEGDDDDEEEEDGVEGIGDLRLLCTWRDIILREPLCSIMWLSCPYACSPAPQRHQHCFPCLCVRRRA